MENGKNGCVMFEDWEISDAVLHYKMEKTCFPLSLLLFFTLETAASTEFFLIFSPLMKTSASYSQCDECKHMTLTESALAWQHEAAPEWKFNKYNHGKWLLFIDHIYYNAIDCTHRHWLWWVFVFFSVTTFSGGLGCMERHWAQRTARVYFYHSHSGITVFSKGRREKSIGSRWLLSVKINVFKK